MTRYDYSVFKRDICTPSCLSTLEFDVLISAYNESDRVKILWDNVSASRRIWINHAEYGFLSGELPPSDYVHEGAVGEGELEFWAGLFSHHLMPSDRNDMRIGIDITGLMRPHVIALPLSLALHGYTAATILYSDPNAYSGGSATPFSIGPILTVAPINGFEGVHNTGVNQEDLLVIGSGYDDQVIRAAAESKRSADHVVLIGLPSLQPHMYQESLLRLHKASESIKNYSKRNHLFSPANDPFITAGVLSEYLARKFAAGIDNVYLCPTGPKTQALGFSWYFLCEAMQTPTSIIYPYAGSYSQETSKGLARTHTFELELASIDISVFV